MDNLAYIHDVYPNGFKSNVKFQTDDHASMQQPQANRNGLNHLHKNHYMNKKENSKDDDVKKWPQYSTKEKIIYIILAILKAFLFIILLYLFLLSLNFMTIGFTLVSGYTIRAGPTIKFLLSNPFAALSVGIIITALMQNATATTSITISMVGAHIIPDVKTAIPIIIGANIGTCVTNALIALTLADDPHEFKRAFSGATLNDMFNFLTTAVVLPIEILSGFLNLASKAITDIMPFENAEEIAKANFISGILNPVCDLFILLDHDVVERLLNGGNETNVALRCCESIKVLNNFTYLSVNFTVYSNSSSYDTICIKKCTYWCMPMIESIGDGGTGLFWIIISIIVLIICLFGIVKVLSLLIVGPIAHAVNVAINASLPGKMKWFTEVMLFIFSLLITIIVQSSNIVTATLVPLCGIGIVNLQRVYVLTLGSNIGTTVTGILTAFTQSISAMKSSLQLAFVYTLFNSIGVILWLPIPKLRFPIYLSRKLGNIVLKYRWFVILYATSIYFVLPSIVFGLALIPYWIGLAIFGIPLILLLIFLIVVTVLRQKAPKVLPQFLLNFDWLPECLRSLEPLDRRIKKLGHCCKGFRCSKKRGSITLATPVEDNPIVKEIVDDITHKLPDAIRRMSVVESIVDDARVFSRRNSFNVDIDEETTNETDEKMSENHMNNSSYIETSRV